MPELRADVVGGDPPATRLHASDHPVAAQDLPAAQEARPVPPHPDEILRFRKSERQLHWAIAVPFMVSLVSGAVLVTLYNPNPLRPLRGIVSWAHRISGICMIVLPLWTFVRHREDLRVYMDNIRRAWTWTLEDVKWLFLMGPASMNSKISLPHQGKFNAAEKINFMVLTSTYPAYIITGVLIWLPGVAYLSWLMHFAMAVVALPLILGHIFMATVNPDTRVGLQGMISGFVDRHWAKHHYRLWYDELFGQQVESSRPAAGAERPAPPPAPLPVPHPVAVREPSPEGAHPIRPTRGPVADAT